MKLHYEEWGVKNNNVIIFLHGLGGRGKLFHSLARTLENDYYLIAFDQRGHGLSQIEATDFTPKRMAADVLESLSAYEKIIVVGHSMGVRTALNIEHPSLKAIIAIDLSPTAPLGGGMGTQIATFIDTIPYEFSSRDEAKNTLLSLAPDPSLAKYLLATLELNHGVYKFPFDASALKKIIAQSQTHLEHQTLKLAQMNLPIFFLKGAQSSVWKPEQYLEDQKKLSHPLIHFEEWENCGHGLPFEVKTRLSNFIRCIALSVF